MTKASVNASVHVVSGSSGGEKDASMESEKENVKKPKDKETESAKPEKEAEEKSSVSSEILVLTYQ